MSAMKQTGCERHIGMRVGFDALRVGRGHPFLLPEGDILPSSCQSHGAQRLEYLPFGRLSDVEVGVDTKLTALFEPRERRQGEVRDCTISAVVGQFKDRSLQAPPVCKAPITTQHHPSFSAIKPTIEQSCSTRRFERDISQVCS